VDFKPNEESKRGRCVPIDDHYLAERLRNLAPDQSAFRRALKNVKSAPNEGKHVLLNAVEQLKPAKGNVDDFTQAAIDIIQKQIQLAN
jgi:hypothetical protein